MKINPENVIDSLSKHMLVQQDAIVADTELSQGSWIVDARTHKSYLDCFSQFGSQPIGWNHPKVLSQRDRLAHAALHKISNPDIYTQEYAEFVELFATFFDDHDKFFFIDGGALAVENALKAAFDWKTQLNGLFEDECNSLDVVHLKEAFHGRSGYTLSLTNNSYDNKKVKHFPKFPWTRVPCPKIDRTMRLTKMLEMLSLEEIENACKKGKVAAILFETIQGEGGDNHFRSEWMAKVRELATRYDALLILDEVQAGFGSTGKTWAYQWHGVKPDIVAFGKKTQVCGFAANSEKLNRVKENVLNTASRISSTWGGNITDMVRSTIYMEIIREDNLIENARVVGDYFLQGLKKLGLHNARGRGLMIAFDLKDRNERDKFLKKLEEKVLALPCGDKSIRFRPHLTFTQEDVDFALDCLKVI